MNLDGMAFDGMAFDGMAFDEMAFDGTAFDGTAFNETAFNGTAFDGTALNGTGVDGIGWNQILQGVMVNWDQISADPNYAHIIDPKQNSMYGKFRYMDPQATDMMIRARCMTLVIYMIVHMGLDP
jgi:hypothetical protein